MMSIAAESFLPAVSDANGLDALAAAWSELPLPVAVIDLESTGGSLEDDRITEIAVLRYANGTWESYRRLVNPQRPISAFVVQLTGISDEMVADAPAFAELAPELLPMLRGHLLVAHNSSFDYTFLRREFARAGHAFAAPTLCTVQLSRRLYPQFFKHNLDSIIERFAITLPRRERHRASGDVLALTQFLHLSLQDKGRSDWLAQCRTLIRPGFLPDNLPGHLRQAVYMLSDDAGVSEWHQPESGRTVWRVHEHAFSEICQLLSRRTGDGDMPDTVRLRFYPAAGLLHAHALRGRFLADAADRNTSETRTAPTHSVRGRAKWYTAVFQPDAHGRLQAHVRPVCDGVSAERPHGLFAHPKAAKRALAEWAFQYQICPAALDILPQSLGTGQSCPRAAAHLCDGSCRSTDAVSAHNQKVLEYADMLPVCGRNGAHELNITERAASPATASVVTVQSGCLKIDDNHWYFHEDLPNLLKKHTKSRKNTRQTA